MSTCIVGIVRVALDHHILPEAMHGDMVDVQAVLHAGLTRSLAYGDAVISGQKFGRIKKVEFVDDARPQSRPTYPAATFHKDAGQAFGAEFRHQCRQIDFPISGGNR